MAAEKARFLAKFLTRFRRAATPADAPTPLPSLLEHVRQSDAADWLRHSVNTFAENVASVLPGHFEAYARIYHPFEYDDGTIAPAPSWRELTAAAGAELTDPEAAVKFADDGWDAGQARVGRLPPMLIAPLVEHLRGATGTPERCFFAVWEGHGDLAVPFALEPTLTLPHRRHHILAGPIEGAHTNLSEVDFDPLAANLWWPADQAWCVATEVDFAWTYVGGSRSTIEALLQDPRLEAVETAATARW